MASWVTSVASAFEDAHVVVESVTSTVRGIGGYPAAPYTGTRLFNQQVRADSSPRCKRPTCSGCWLKPTDSMHN